MAKGGVVQEPQGEIKVEKVKAFDDSKGSPELESQVTLNCSDAVLEEFRKIISGTKILGAKYNNPYTGAMEQFPNNPKEFTARHLQIIARNEYANTTGIMNTELYNGLLTNDQIARIRCLVKSTNVCGVVNVHSKGGYPQPPKGMPTEELSQQQKFILVDQSGLQWQNDFHNTGGMFFYPSEKISDEYSQYQNDMYQVMYGKVRPKQPSSNSISVKWNGKQGKLDLDQLANAIEVEFRQAIDAVKNQGNSSLGENDKINFKFLKAGMGFFAGGLDRDKVKFEQARLKGILQALKYLETLKPEERKAALGKISRLELPFSNSPVAPEISETLKLIEESAKKIGLEWGGAPYDDVFEPREGYVNASTNCGDPHAMIGNEGHYGSVDAAIACNAYVNHLNPAFNSKIQLKEMPIIQPSSPKSVGYRQGTPPPEHQVGYRLGAMDNEPILEQVEPISRTFTPGLTKDKTTGETIVAKQSGATIKELAEYLTGKETHYGITKPTLNPEKTRLEFDVVHEDQARSKVHVAEENGELKYSLVGKSEKKEAAIERICQIALDKAKPGSIITLTGSPTDEITEKKLIEGIQKNREKGIYTKDNPEPIIKRKNGEIVEIPKKHALQNKL